MPYFATTDGTKIYYETHGRGETLIFCHGLNSSHLAIKNFIGEFKNDYRTVCYDQRGHAASDKAKIHLNVKTLGQDLKELIDYLELDEVTAIGHSMGAATIFSYVNQFGCEHLKRIVACDMSPYMRNDGWTGGYIREHIKSNFTLASDFPNTTHTILLEKPHEVAEQVKKFIEG